MKSDKTTHHKREKHTEPKWRTTVQVLSKPRYAPPYSPIGEYAYTPHLTPIKHDLDPISCG